MDSAQTAGLVERALRMTYILRGGGPAGAVFHADRGTQYASAQLKDVCVGLGIRQSVGRTGVCWDNAMQESFWSTLKTEFYDRRPWATRQDAIRATGRWIERSTTARPAPLSPELQHPGRARTAALGRTTSAGTRRLINCPQLAGQPRNCR